VPVLRSIFRQSRCYEHIPLTKGYENKKQKRAKCPSKMKEDISFIKITVGRTGRRSYEMRFGKEVGRQR